MGHLLKFTSANQFSRKTVTDLVIEFLHINDTIYNLPISSTGKLEN